MSVSVFAERLRNAMNSRGLKQVDLVHAAEHRGVKTVSYTHLTLPTKA